MNVDNVNQTLFNCTKKTRKGYSLYLVNKILALALLGDCFAYLEKSQRHRHTHRGYISVRIKIKNQTSD